MSYCRMGVDGSEVYAYEDAGGFWVVWHEGQSSRRDTLEEFKAFMLELRGRGIRIPDYAFAEIEDDIREARDAAVASAMQT